MNKKTNLKKWAAMVKTCRGTRTREKLSEETGLSESTIGKWEKEKMKPTKPSVDALITACPHVDPNKIYLAAGLDIIVAATSDLEDELLLGKILYSKLINANLEEYDVKISKDKVALYANLFDLMIKAIVESKSIDDNSNERKTM